MTISGHFVYKGLAISQHSNIEQVFCSLLLDLKPKRIIEIGTFHGGLALMIKDILDQNLISYNFRTYDTVDQVFLKDIVGNCPNLDIYNKNIFNDSYNDFLDISTKNELKSYIEESGVTLVICDGGSKKNEFKLFAELIKEGDVIMAHDYAPDATYFQEHMYNKIWNWHEIQDSDINESIQNHNLQPYMREEFLNAAWACFKKS